MIAAALDLRGLQLTALERATVFDERLTDFQSLVDQRLDLSNVRAQIGASIK